MSKNNSSLYHVLTRDYIDLSVKVNACFANDPEFFKQLQKRREEEAAAKQRASEKQSSEGSEPETHAEESENYDRDAHKRFMRNMR
ncbi:MAG: hypothetical protein NZ828_04810 [Alphaproteobacteria bacterium]|jgi:hypothetical protein|nr:hypothetical protein [Alphaproteobacteria bacterium]